MQVLITAEEVQRRIQEMAKDIAKDFHGQPTTIVGVLTGCIMFLADLVRRLDLSLRIDLIQASSYRGKTTKPGQLKIAPELVPDVRGRHVLLLDDILDTGQTLKHVVCQLQDLGAVSVRVAVLLRKLGRQQVELVSIIAASTFQTSLWSATDWISTTSIAICRMWRCCPMRRRR